MRPAFKISTMLRLEEDGDMLGNGPPRAVAARFRPASIRSRKRWTSQVSG
jgi:hypothetical protein